MSLVDYGSSGDEEEDEEEVNQETVKETKTNFDTGCISDSDEDSTHVALEVPVEGPSISGFYSLVLPEPKISTAQKEDQSIICENSQDINLFSALPAPTTTLPQDDFEEGAELIILPTQSEILLREKPPAKRKAAIIVAPAIEDSDSDEENPKKIKPQISSRSALFDLLPKPKSGSSKEVGRPLIPHTLTKRAQPSEKMISMPVRPAHIPTTAEKLSSKTKTALSTLDYDASDDDDGVEGCGFFTLPDKNDLKLHETVDISAQANLDLRNFGTRSQELRKQPFISDKKQVVVSSQPSRSVLDSTNSDYTNNLPLQFEHSAGSSDLATVDGSETIEWEPSSYDYSYEPYSLPDQYCDQGSNYIQDEQFLRMQGKKHQGKEPINIIDVHVDDQVTGYSLEQTKELTKEVGVISHSKKRNPDLPTSQQKRKHQITYLAHQAKEREIELKNQWAENRYTKKQTQSKYGF